MATGVANISEQGVATTRTDNIVSGRVVINQPKKLTAKTIGVNHIAYRSARR